MVPMVVGSGQPGASRMGMEDFRLVASRFWHIAGHTNNSLELFPMVYWYATLVIIPLVLIPTTCGLERFKTTWMMLSEKADCLDADGQGKGRVDEILRNIVNAAIQCLLKIPNHTIVVADEYVVHAFVKELDAGIEYFMAWL